MWWLHLHVNLPSPFLPQSDDSLLGNVWLFRWFCIAIHRERRDIYSDTAGIFWLLIHRDGSGSAFVECEGVHFLSVYNMPACVHTQTCVWVICLFNSWLFAVVLPVHNPDKQQLQRRENNLPSSLKFLFTSVNFFPPKTETDWRIHSCHTPKMVMQMRNRLGTQQGLCQIYILLRVHNNL